MRAISRNRLFVEEQAPDHAARSMWRERILDFLLRVSFIKNTGLQNALDVRLERVEMVFANLPKGFDNTRLLFVTDQHLDGEGTLADQVLSITGELDYDLCILGGDYSYSRTGNCGRTYPQIRKLVKRLRDKSRVFGILGNYDTYSVAELLDGCGVEMLINDAVCLEREGDRVYLA